MTVLPAVQIVPVPARGRLRAGLVALRPRQWAKNLLAVGAPLAAGRIDDLPVMTLTGCAIVALCLASSCGYLVNDLRDAAEDRGHPVKCHRPVARGEVSGTVALTAAGALGVAAVGVAWLISSALVELVAAYLVITVAYSLRLRREPVVEMVVVATCFVLRAAAGGAAAGLPLSPWYLLVAGFGSLFVIGGKRYSELVTCGARPGGRAVLATYTPSYLRFVWATAAALTLVTYLLWADNVYTVRDEGPWALWSIVPLLLALLRYARDIEAGRAEAPEHLLARDRTLQALALLWLLMIAVGANGLGLGW